MSIRVLTDQGGMEWQVFEVYPDSERASRGQVPLNFREGWLCFQSSYERRRLAPIPLGWRMWDDVALLLSLRQCTGVRRRTPPSHTAQPRTSGEHDSVR